MDQIIIAGYTVQDAMLLVFTGIGILILAAILKKIFKKETVKPYMQAARCNQCGWQGQVSRHAGRCPGCNMPLGDRMIGRSPSNEGQITGNHFFPSFFLNSFSTTHLYPSTALFFNFSASG